MTRQSTKIDIPEIYIENEKKGLCRVCGKPKTQFAKFKRVFCSDECDREYQKCFKTWNSLRDELFEENGNKCEKCGSGLSLEIDHKHAIVNGGDMWDKNNLQVLCRKCHLKKTRLDLYKKKNVKVGQKVLNTDLTCV